MIAVAATYYEPAKRPADEAWIVAASDRITSVKRDPGLEVAVYDLYNAAAVIVASSPISAAVVDARPWRLLMDAARRIRARLNALVPRQDVET